MVLVGDLCCTLEIVFRFLVYRKHWRAYFVQGIALRMYDVARLFIYLASGYCVPFYLRWAWFLACGNERAARRWCTHKCDLAAEATEPSLNCADEVKMLHFSAECQTTFQTSLCVMSTLFFLPIWLLLLFPRVLSGYLHIWVLGA